MIFICSMIIHLQLSLNCYDKIICPYNCSGHWELVVIFPHQKTIMYLDPLGENDKKKKSILQSWKTFINRRFSAGLESSGPSKWKIETAPHCKQLDSVSCGVYVMKVGRSLLVLSIFVNPCITKTNTKYNLTRTF